MSKVKLNLYYVRTNEHLKLKSLETREKSPENYFLKGNNSIKSRENATKVQVDQHYVKEN